MATPRPRDALLDPRFLAIPVFAYGCLRAGSLSITHDEALTYLFHVRAPWAAVLAFSAPLPSNNHLLNTLAVKALLSWLPPSELVLRLPALVGLALYLWAAQRLIRGATTGIRRPLGFLLLAANPFVLDLLVVSRGYALALGLSLAALALLLDGDDHPRVVSWRRVLAASAAALAVVANLAFAFSFAAIALVAVALVPTFGDRSGKRSFGSLAATAAPFVVAGGLLRAVYTPPVVARIQRVVASWGGEDGVWRDTVGTLAEGVLYGDPWFVPAHHAWVSALTAAAAVVLTAGAVVALAKCWGGSPRAGERALGACALCVVAWMVLAVAAHSFGGIRYPLERAASLLVPLLTLAFVLLWEAAAVRARRGTAMACVVLAVAALAHFAGSANFSHTFLWRLDADMRPAMRTIARAAATAPPEALRLGVSWELEPAANFYRVTRGVTGLAPVTRAEAATGFDLYLFTAADASQVERLGLHRCSTFPLADSVLAAAPGLPCPAQS